MDYVYVIKAPVIILLKAFNGWTSTSVGFKMLTSYRLPVKIPIFIMLP